MSTGVSTLNIDRSNLVDEVIGNRNGSTVVTPVDELALQVRASPAFVSIEEATSNLDHKLDSSISVMNGKIDSSISVLNTRIEDLSITGDTVTKATWAQLLASPGTRTGQRGLVEADLGTHTDPAVGGTVANMGIYAWNGSAWQWLRPDDFGSVTRRVGAPLSLSGPIIVDFTNKLGGGAAVYIPEEIVYRNATDGNVFLASLPSDPKMVKWHKVPVAETHLLQTIYYDRVDNAVKVAVTGTGEMPIDVNRYFHLLAIWGSNYGTSSGVTSLYEVRNTANEGAFISAVERALVFDRTIHKLYVPELNGYYRGHLPWTLRTLNSGEAYREIQLPTSGPSYQVWVDTFDIALNGQTSPTAIKVTQGFSGITPVNPLGNAGLILLGQGFGRWFAPVLGMNLANIVPNEFFAGREDNDMAARTHGASVAVDLKDPVSKALGFTRGYSEDLGEENRSYYGGYFKQPRNSGVVTCRYFIETDVPGQFGTPFIYLFSRSSDGSEAITRRNVVFVKEHSPTVREYQEVANLSSGELYTGLWAGSHSEDTVVRVFGLQFACVAENNPWISVRDYPRMEDDEAHKVSAIGSINGGFLPIDPVLPLKLWMIDERRYPLYFDQLTRYAAEGGRLRAAKMRLAATNTQSNDIEQCTGGTLRFSEEDGDTVRILLHDKAGDKNRHHYGDVQLHIASETDIGALPPIRIHCIGDSLTNSTGTAVNTIRRMVEMGANITAFGGRDMQSVVTGDGSLMGEGRGGKEFADFIYEKTDSVSPTTPTAYNAASDSAKANLNPYLRAATGSDNPAFVFNGYVFDFRHYLNSFGYPDPEVVLLNLGTNDISRNDAATAKSRLKNGLSVMVSQIRAACPQALIVLPFNAYGRATGEGRWAGNQWDGLKVFTEFVRQKADDKLILLPAYCTVQRDLGFQNSALVDPATGMVTATTSDATHYSDIGVRQFGEVGAQTILAKLILG